MNAFHTLIGCSVDDMAAIPFGSGNALHIVPLFVTTRR